MYLKSHTLIIVLLFISLCGCRQVGPSPPLSPSFIPTPSSSPTSTPLPRWMVYQTALSRAVLNSEDGVCEWEIFAIAHDEVYLWAMCGARGPIATKVSVPAVVYLGENGDIIKVAFPGDGINYGKDVRALLPPEIQKRIFTHDTQGYADMDHVDARLTADGPPLIVIAGTPML